MTEDEIRKYAERYADSPDDVEALVASVLERQAWRARRGYKMCSTCHEAKKPSAFGSDASRRDGLSPRCLECERKRDAERRVNG